MDERRLITHCPECKSRDIHHALGKKTVSLCQNCGQKILYTDTTKSSVNFTKQNRQAKGNLLDWFRN
jgi:DNA-directed RNA polymerase subunit RPC12/RpoP